MNKKLCKLIMELIFIFIFPIAFMLISVKSEVVNTYDENGNLLTSEKIFDFSEDTILRDYNDNLQYKNIIHFNQLFDDSEITSGDRNGVTFTFNNHVLEVNGTATALIQTFILPSVELNPNHFYYITSIGSLYGNVTVQLSNDNISYLTANLYKANNIKNARFYIQINNGDTVNGNYIFQIYDLTEMFGNDYIPDTIDDFYNIIPKEYNGVVNYDIVKYSNDILSSDYEINYTWYSKLFNELYNDLQINNNIVLKLITTYIILWVIMFLVWHLLYRFVDFMVHLFDRKD